MMTKSTSFSEKYHKIVAHLTRPSFPELGEFVRWGLYLFILFKEKKICLECLVCFRLQIRRKQCFYPMSHHSNFSEQRLLMLPEIYSLEKQTWYWLCTSLGKSNLLINYNPVSKWCCIDVQICTSDLLCFISFRWGLTWQSVHSGKVLGFLWQAPSEWRDI